MDGFFNWLHRTCCCLDAVPPRSGLSCAVYWWMGVAQVRYWLASHATQLQGRVGKPVGFDWQRSLIRSCCRGRLLPAPEHSRLFLALRLLQPSAEMQHSGAEHHRADYYGGGDKLTA